MMCIVCKLYSIYIYIRKHLSVINLNCKSIYYELDMVAHTQISIGWPFASEDWLGLVYDWAHRQSPRHPGHINYLGQGRFSSQKPSRSEI